MSPATIFTVAAGIVLLGHSAKAAMLTESATAPTGALISQTDFSGGAGQNGGQGTYSDQAAIGQTFTAPINFTLTSVTIKGAGSNSAGNNVGGNINGVFIITIGTLDATNNIQTLVQETASIYSVVADDTNYLTFTLTPDPALNLTAGSVYSYRISTQAQNFYFGFAGSPDNTNVANPVDAYPGGVAITAGDRQNPGGTYQNTFPEFDRTFFVEGVPEPGTVTLSVLAAGGWLILMRRRLLVQRRSYRQEPVAKLAFG